MTEESGYLLGVVLSGCTRCGEEIPSTAFRTGSSFVRMTEWAWCFRWGGRCEAARGPSTRSGMTIVGERDDARESPTHTHTH